MPPFLYAVLPLFCDDAAMFVNDGIFGKLRACQLRLFISAS